MNIYTLHSWYPDQEPGYFTTTLTSELLKTWAEWLSMDDEGDDDGCRYILYINGIPAFQTHHESDEDTLKLEDDAIVDGLTKTKEAEGKSLYELAQLLKTKL